MTDQTATVSGIAVIKLGGSVLADFDSYGDCAERLVCWISIPQAEHFVVVVSAEFGTTDRLLDLAQSACPDPDPDSLDLLWSTGELRSVALLTLWLRRHGIDAVGLNVHQCGLNSVDGAADVVTVSIDTAPLRHFVHRHPVVVVPGFVARGPFDSIVTLGRGASDLTAVLLAGALGANRCELVKDVPGYFNKDPNRYDDARPVPSLSYAEALHMAADGCDLVQAAALREAQALGCPLIIRSLDPKQSATVVRDEPWQDKAGVVPATTAARA